MTKPLISQLVPELPFQSVLDPLGVRPDGRYSYSDDMNDYGQDLIDDDNNRYLSRSDGIEIQIVRVAIIKWSENNLAHNSVYGSHKFVLADPEFVNNYKTLLTAISNGHELLAMEVVHDDDFDLEEGETTCDMVYFKRLSDIPNYPANKDIEAAPEWQGINCGPVPCSWW